MYRTPAKKTLAPSSDSSPEDPPRATVAQARRSFERQPVSPAPKPAEQARQLPRPQTTYMDRKTEAAALLERIKKSINLSRNTKTEIKNEILESASRMCRLVREAERETELVEKATDEATAISMRIAEEEQAKTEKFEKDITTNMEEQTKLMKDMKEAMEKTNEEIRKYREENTSQRTYASAVSGSPKVKTAEVAPTLHSIIVTSKDDQETGEEVLEKIKQAVKARDDGIRVDRIRKAKDRKIIIGCQDKTELTRVKTNIQKNGKNLNIEDVKNKNPFIIIRHLINSHTDEEITTALRNQNKHLLDGLNKHEENIEVTHRRKTRNPLVVHVILRVSPQIWRRFTDAGVVFVDVQRVKVEDQSPLVQCSKCLGYGHGRRFCLASLEACTHCGGPHKKAECADWLAAEPATCCNCQRAKLADVAHNAYSDNCPVRKKWDQLARSCVAYC